MDIEVVSHNGILHVMNDGLKVGWLEQKNIILRKVMMSYLYRRCKEALVDLFVRVNVINL